MMNVKDYVHAVIVSIIHHFLHTVQPHLGNLIIFIYMGMPGNRDTDGIESRFLNIVNHFLSCCDSHPLCFAVKLIGKWTFSESIEGIAQIPANLHVMYKRKGLGIRNVIRLNVHFWNLKFRFLTFAALYTFTVLSTFTTLRLLPQRNCLHYLLLHLNRSLSVHFLRPLPRYHHNRRACPRQEKLPVSLLLISFS